MSLELGRGKPLGYQQLTVSSTAVALTVPTNAEAALVDVESNDVRWRDDGTNPTASVGKYLSSGTHYTFIGAEELAALKFIRVSADAKLNITYYIIS